VEAEPTPVAIAKPETGAIAEPPPIVIEEPVSVRPLPELQNNLWAAAAMVADAATANIVPPSPIGPGPLPLARLPETVERKPEPPAAAPEPERDVAPIAAFMTTLRNAPGPTQWAVFGGTAAFLGAIWAVIWFAVGK